MKMKSEKYIAIFMIISIMSYFMMVSMSFTASAEDLNGKYLLDDRLLKEHVIYNLRDAYIGNKRLIRFTHNLTKLEYDESEYIIEECLKDNLNPFIVLGVIKKESNFNPRAVGKFGEKGLGQLMENTAKPVAENLGYIYDPKKLFDSRYNIKLTITQLTYLYKLYDKDINKTLTAYNRGQNGLEEYMKQDKSDYEDPAMSDYSVDVINFAKKFKDEFDNFKE